MMTDVFTNVTQAVPTREQRASTTAKLLLREGVFKYGIPLRINSDKGKCFENAVITEGCKLYDIEKPSTTAYHPQGNAQCQRFNRTMHNLLPSLQPEKKRKWPEYLPRKIPLNQTGWLPTKTTYGMLTSKQGSMSGSMSGSRQMLEKQLVTRIPMTRKLKTASLFIYIAISEAEKRSTMLGTLLCTKFKIHQVLQGLCIQLSQPTKMDPARQCIGPC